MPMEKMLDLAFEIYGNGTIALEQVAGSLEGPAYIDLHPMQLRMLAERAGLLEPVPLPTAAPYLIDGGNEFQHLQIEQDEDGTVNLYQTQIHGMGGSDEHLILHPTQAAWLGARLLALSSIAMSPSEPLESAPSGAVNKSQGHGQQLGLPV